MSSHFNLDIVLDFIVINLFSMAQKRMISRPAFLTKTAESSLTSSLLDAPSQVNMLEIFRVVVICLQTFLSLIEDPKFPEARVIHSFKSIFVNRFQIVARVSWTLIAPTRQSVVRREIEVSDLNPFISPLRGTRP
jgi:hypothetical protein